MPESPRWLTRRGRYDEALLSLASGRGVPRSEAADHFIINREMEEMREAVEYEKTVQTGWLDCFALERKQLYRTLLVATLQMFQQLTGANYFFYVRPHLSLLIVQY